MNYKQIIVVISILSVVNATCMNELKVLEGISDNIVCKDLGIHRKGCAKVDEMNLVCFLKPLEHKIDGKCYTYNCRWSNPWEDEYKINVKVQAPYDTIEVELKPTFDVPILVQLVFTLAMICVLSACFTPGFLFLDFSSDSSSGSSSGFC